MFFTQNDYKKIEEYLRLNSKKDTDFKSIDDTMIKPTDWVAIVQNNASGNHKNVKVQIKDLTYDMFKSIINGTDNRFSDIVDSIPTKGSIKLVKSSGIWHAINDPDVIDTHQIKNNSVTTQKLEDGSVVAEKLDYWAVHTDQIANKNVTEEKLADGAVTPEKLSPEAAALLQGIVVEGNIDHFEYGTTEQLTITARTANGEGGYWTVYRDNQEIFTDSGENLSFSDTVNAAHTYLITCAQGEHLYKHEYSVVEAYPFWIGGGSDAANARNDNNKRGAAIIDEDVANMYDVTLSETQKIWVEVPSGVVVRSIKMNGIDIPQSTKTEEYITIGSNKTVLYNIYSSEHSYYPDGYQIQINHYESEEADLLESLVNKVNTMPNVHIEADEEDIELHSTTKPYSNEHTAEIRLKDKEYEPHNFSGLGRKYLRKNIVPIIDGEYRIFAGFVENVPLTDTTFYGNTETPTDEFYWDRVHECFVIGPRQEDNKYTKVRFLSAQHTDVVAFNNIVYISNNIPYLWNNEDLIVDDVLRESNETFINLLTQEDINTPHTIYHIQYDFDLNGQTIQVPEDCVLLFEGGSLNNGTIILNDTIILHSNADLLRGTNLIIEGEYSTCGEDGGGYQNHYYDSTFKNDSIVLDWFFKTEGLEGWTISDVTSTQPYIEDKKLVIVNSGTISRDIQLKGKHWYLFTTYADIQKVLHNSSGGYIEKSGIGFWIQDANPSYYRDIDVRFVGNGQIGSVPITYILYVKNDITVTFKVGAKKSSNFKTNGTIDHIGIYDITKFASSSVDSNAKFSLQYETFYKAYQSYIFSKIRDISTRRLDGIVYLESEAKKEFIKEMNRTAERFGMLYSHFSHPAGSNLLEDSSLENGYWKNSVSCINTQTGYYYAYKSDKNAGVTKTQRSSSILYSYPVHEGTMYFISNIQSIGVSAYYVVFLNGNNEICGRAENSYSDIKAENPFGNYLFVTAPEDAVKMIVTSSGTAPKVFYYSDLEGTYAAQPTSVKYYNAAKKGIYTATREFTPCHNFSTSRDLAVLAANIFSDVDFRSLYTDRYHSVRITNNGITRTCTYSLPKSAVTSANIAYMGKGGNTTKVASTSFCGVMCDRLDNGKLYAFGVINNEVEDDRINNSSLAPAFKDLIEIQRGATNKVMIGTSGAMGPIRDWYPNGDMLTTSYRTQYNFITVDKNGKDLGFPCSVSKLITAYLALKVLGTNTYVKMEKGDFGSSNAGLTYGDTINVKDAIVTMLATSDNALAMCLGRHIGTKLLKEKNIIL